MPLEEYKRRRDFSQTSEPAPGRVTTRKSKLAYVIQKHDATRLHYDFRLELDGVLLSWAVTKGPSINPSDKRLAVRTEDHPLSYGGFEGTIPKGQYGGGTVMLWDEGVWEPKADPHDGLKKGHLSFELHGERLKGGWDLVRMRGDEKRENWLLIKENDGEAGRKGQGESFLKLFASSVRTGRSMEQIADNQTPRKRAAAQAGHEIERLMNKYPEVQLATLVESPPEGEEWIHEIKLDGYRLLGFVSGGEARLRTRNGNDWTASFPSVASALEELPAKSAVLDMEAVVLDPGGKSSFQALQAALSAGVDRGRIVAFVFDLLHLDGKDLTSISLTGRKEKLRKLLGSSRNPALRFSDHIAGQGAQMFAKACESGLEGIVSKKAGDPYIAGRQKSWLKTKCAHRQEFVILGYSSARSGNRALGALYLGYHDKSGNGRSHKDGALRYAGKVGTGFTMQSARELATRLNAMRAAKSLLSRAEMGGLAAAEWGSVQWVKPELLCEVAFTEWTEDGRIRHPSFQGLREDKGAGEVTRDKPDSLTVLGIRVTHPDRVISEDGHVTKGELAEYYAAAAQLLLPRIVRHPISLLRCPYGVNGECFFQRNPGKGLGGHVRPFEFRHKGKTYQYLYIEDEKGLLEIVQMGAIEIHPWGASIDAIDYPDRVIFDLDPAPEVPLDALKLAAQDLRQRLRKHGMEAALKCTGGKGLHVVVALDGKEKWPEVKSFAASIADGMVADAPEAYVATMSKAKRAGKIFVDYFRNDYTATAIADYAVRARPRMPVALPIEWSELKTLQSPDQFTMKDVLARLK